MKSVIIYTDGACSGNPGPGGWGALLECDGKERRLSGGAKETTNNRMELTAAIEGLRALKVSCQVKVYTDSKYVQQGITTWLKRWKQKNWKSSSGKVVKNIDLWQDLDLECQRHQVEWHWVKGHAGCWVLNC